MFQLGYPFKTSCPLPKVLPTFLGRLSVPIHSYIGAYIISPLEEASRDPVQNAGFVVEWRNTRHRTRVTSYSLRNSVDLPSSPSPSGPSVSPNNANKFTSRGRSSMSPTRSVPLSPSSPFQCVSETNNIY